MVVSFLMFGLTTLRPAVVLFAAADHWTTSLLGRQAMGSLVWSVAPLRTPDLVGTAGLANPNRPAGDDDDVIAPVVAVEAEGLVLVQGVQAHGLAVLRHLHGPAGVAVAMDQDHAKNGCGGDDGDEDHPKAQGLCFFRFHSSYLQGVWL